MTAKIYRPAKTAMQAGKANSHIWMLEFDQEKPRSIDPIMGYTSSADMKSQIQIRFRSREEAVAYATRNGISFRVVEPKESTRRRLVYADNFRFDRRVPWTH